MKHRIRLVLLFLGSVVFYNEFLSYTLQAWLKWPSVACEDCIKILLVADPQIIGERYESHGFLARWDCDRYLSKTFRRAMAHTDPHVVAFLGDIMDEGSIASKDEYWRYVRRFFSIFHIPSSIKALYLPGDNDIGGEDDEITAEKLKRYNKNFPQTSSLRFKQVDIYHTNRLTFSLPRLMDNRTALWSNRTRIVLSHLPLLFLPSKFVHSVVSTLRPHVIFTAHDHRSVHTSLLMDFSPDSAVDADASFSMLDIESLLPKDGPWWHFQLGLDRVHEITVPTCSYRMGVADMGYGVAVIDVATQRLAYTVLWLPSRFSQLGVYVGAILVVFLYSILFAMNCLRRSMCPITRRCFV